MELTASSVECSAREASAQLRCACGSEQLVDLGPCRLLGKSRRVSEYESQLSAQIDPGRLYRCRNCHLGLRLPRPSDETIASLYESISTTRWREGIVAGAAQQRLIRSFGRDNGKRWKVLDIGAFDGSFLRALPASFEKAAIEPSDAAAQLERHGIHVLKSFLAPATASEAGQYDVVTMFDVFEHLADPIGGVQAAMSYVRPGGQLYIGTGNMDHWSWRASRGSHWYLDPIQHLVVGSRRHFAWQTDRIGAVSCHCTSLGHQTGTLLQRCSQALTTVYFSARSSGVLGKPLVRLMNLIPSYRRMSHKTLMPYTQQLHDHLLVEFVRGEASA